MKERQQTALRHVIEGSGYRSDFPGWVAANWEIYEEFERLSLAALKRGRIRLSAKFLCELIRWNSALREEGPYKVNNVYSADLARLAVKMNPDLESLFEFRARAMA